MIGTRHLRTSIALPMIFLVMVSFLSAGFLAIQAGRKTIYEMIKIIHEEISNRITAKLTSYLDTPHGINDINQLILEMNPHLSGEVETLQKLFYKQLRDFPSANLIAYGGEDGEYAEAQRLEDGTIRVGEAGAGTGRVLELWNSDETGTKTSLARSVVNYDPRLRPWYKASLSAGKPAWSEIYPYYSNQDLAISGNQPFFDREGIFRGVLTTSITLREMNQFLSGLSAGKTGQTFIIDSSGLLLACSTDIALLTSEGERQSAADSDLPILAAAIGHLSREKEVQNFSFKIEGDTILGRATPYSSPHDLTWMVLILIPESDFTEAQVVIAWQGLLILALTLITIIVISLVIANRTSLPVEVISDAFEALSVEGWSRAADLIPSKLHRRKDEIGKLSISFSRMVDKLEEAFNMVRKSEKNYREVVEGVNSIIMKISPEGIITYSNRFGLDFFGYTEEELIGQPQTLLTTDALDKYGNLLDHLIENIYKNPGKYVINENENIKKNGKRAWVMWANRLILDEAGNITELLCIGYDITEKRLFEENLNTSIREKEVLLKEIHHRVKNNLQIIISLLNLQSANLSGSFEHDIFRTIRGRIHSMSLIHEMLYGSDSFASIRLDMYIKNIAAAIAAAYSFAEKRIDIIFNVDPLPLDIDRSLSCGLILNELISNAFKYAFPDRDKGVITITFREHSEDTILLAVEDNGIGSPESAGQDEPKGIGNLLIEELAKQINGSVERSFKGGTSIRITFPREATVKQIKPYS